MRRQTASPYLLLPLLFCLVLPVAARGSELEPQSGKAEMTFRLPDLHDQEHSLPDYRGTVVLVNFWASWCPPCVQEMPDLARLQQRLADRRFQVLALNVGEKKYRVRKFVNLIGFHLPVLLDTTSEIFDTWHVKTLPTTFLIAADGRVRYRALGNPDWNDPDTVAVIETLLSETGQQPADPPPDTDIEVN
jgi:thiol-disulfide isomerase/thioredoxin